MAPLAIKIDEMEIEDRLHLMEEIWQSLKSIDMDELTPDWHFEILKNRENRDNFIDLETSKQELAKTSQRLKKV